MVVFLYFHSTIEQTFKYLNINIMDISGMNIRAHFNECCTFIENARLAGGIVFVHWYINVSW